LIRFLCQPVENLNGEAKYIRPRSSVRTCQQEIGLMADAVLHLPLLQVIDTSTPCAQLLSPQPRYRWHSAIDLSLPLQ